MLNTRRSEGSSYFLQLDNKPSPLFFIFFASVDVPVSPFWLSDEASVRQEIKAFVHQGCCSEVGEHVRQTSMNVGFKMKWRSTSSRYHLYVLCKIKKLIEQIK